MCGRNYYYDWKIIQTEYDSGLSYRDLIKKYGMSVKTLVNANKRGDLVIRTHKDAMSLSKIKKPQKHSIETKQKLSEIRVNSLNEKAFYSKRTTYKGIKLDSSYELELAKSLDENNIKWVRPKSLIWDDNGQLRRYIPDFYLPDYNVYLDPKNDFLIKKDKRKIKLTEEYNNVTILVLDKNNLSWDSILKLL